MRKLSFVNLRIMLCTALLIVASLAVSVAAEPAEIYAVSEAVPSDNVLYRTDFDSPYSLNGVSASSDSLKQVLSDNGAYLQFSHIPINTSGINISHPTDTIPAGTYKFTGYFRMMYVDEVTALRLLFVDKNGASQRINIYPTSDEWMKVEYYVTLDAPLDYIRVCGAEDARYIQPYCIDNFSLVSESMPSGYDNKTSWGTYVSPVEAERSQVDSLFDYPAFNEEFESRYEVQGVIVNQDADAFVSSAGSASEQTLREFALGYADSHVTDFMICLNNMNATYPSEVWTDLAEKYLQTEENGYAVDYTNDPKAKGAYAHFIVNGLDYIKTWCETFPEVGINPWISIRMNDLHREVPTSVLVSEFWHKNPQFFRVRRSNTAVSSYFRPAFDYTHKEVREYFLSFINEALGRYDSYGIELDWQREICLWYPGGEYSGLEILNDFMREVERLVGVYEEVRGHEIKICVRVASDIVTNYEHGLDVLTWASEGIVDMIIPTGRYSTTDNDIPVALWTSLMHPYGVAVAPCIEINQLSGTNVIINHTLETYNGIAASFLSQGADKIALYNQYIGGIGAKIETKHKVSTDDETVAGTWRHWNIVSTIGSYDKLMTKNRRVILTYNDTYQFWRKSPAQLPVSVAGGEVVTLRIPFGDVPVGAKVTLKFAASAPNDTLVPKVYVNSVRAKYVGVEPCDGGYTENSIVCYSVPASAVNDGYVVAEIIPTYDVTIDYAEVRVDVE